MQGKVSKLVADKGFGFIKQSGGSTEFFFHRSGMARGYPFEDLVEGQEVEFESEESAKGPRASNVR